MTAFAQQRIREGDSYFLLEKENDHYTIYCDSIGEEYTIRYGDEYGGTPLDAGYEGAEYFWSLTKGAVGTEFDVRVFNVTTKVFHEFTVVVDLEPHFTLT